MDRQIGIDMKDRYLMLIFKIVLLVRKRLSNGSQTENRSDKRKQFIKYRYLVRYLSNKKIIFKIGLLERHLTQTTDFVSLSIRMQGQTKSTNDRSLVSYLANKKEF